MPPSPAKPAAAPDATRDAAIARAVESWFAKNARDLPWRRVTATVRGAPRRDPYHSLVSELMLQQTQVSRVIDRFKLFIDRFPTVESLAAAPEQDVLALWSGLGYYRRARLLHAAARAVVSEFDATFPDDPDLLRDLPGVGRYTAGAVASMALGTRTPVVDGNVTRVLLRVDGARGIPKEAARTGDKRAEAWAWSRAESLVAHAEHPGALNEGLMELGATVCTPMSPRCDACPIARFCIARETGEQDSIPAPKLAAARKPLFCASILIRDARGRLAVERRPATGMWADLWQAPTLESADRAPIASKIIRWLEGDAPRSAPAASRLSRVESFVHTTTHRDVHFDVWRLSAPVGTNASWEWLELDRISTLPLSSVQKRILSSPSK